MASLTDLTINDFQHIFLYLSYLDLINLCDSSKLLQNIIKEFLDDSLKSRLVLQCIASSDMAFNEKIITVEFTYILKFIRHFGNQLRILYFWITDEHKCHNIGIYLNKYCTNLESLFFRSFHLDLSSFFPKAFQVQNLFFEFSTLILKTDQLFSIFPRLKRLSLYQVKFYDEFKVNAYFNSKHLIINSLNTNLDFSLIIYVDDWKKYCVERQKFF